MAEPIGYVVAVARPVRRKGKDLRIEIEYLHGPTEDPSPEHVGVGNFGWMYGSYRVAMAVAERFRQEWGQSKRYAEATYRICMVEEPPVSLLAETYQTTHPTERP